MKTKAQAMAQKNYEKSRRYKDKYTQVCLKLHNEHDSDVISRLLQQDNKAGYIKRLIRADEAAKK